jgi:hypothetical protein
MAQFRKKPVVIEAWDTYQVMISAASSWGDVPEPIREACDKGDVLFAEDHMVIHTLEGDHRADPTDKIIRGVKGELYPCKRDIFDVTYEAVDDGQKA